MLKRSSLIALVLLFCSQVASAGILGSRIDLKNANPTELTIGETLSVAITLDGFQPNAFGVWSADIELPSFLSSPTNFASTFTLSVIEGLGLPSPLAPPPLNANTFFSIHSIGLTQGLDAMVQFETTVLGEGQGVLSVSGTALALTPPFSVSFSNDLAASTYVGTASSASASNSSQALPQASHTPEPNSALIFLPLALISLVRRRSAPTA